MTPLGSAGFIDHYITGVGVSRRGHRLCPGGDIPGCHGVLGGVRGDGPRQADGRDALANARLHLRGRQDNGGMDVSLMVWVVTCVVILGLFVFDFFAHVRVPHDPTFKESAIWSIGLHRSGHRVRAA